MTLRMEPDEAEEAARVIEMLLAELAQVRAFQEEVVAMWATRAETPRVDEAYARVTLLNLLHVATDGNLKGDSE